MPTRARGSPANSGRPAATFALTLSEAGYAMAVLLVALSVMSVMLAAAMPVWKQQVQREKEAELIFRGQQYARAVGLFQRKNGPGTLPPSIAVLVDQRFLRKKYKDPVSNDDFQPLVAGQPVPGQQAGSPAVGATASPQAGGRAGTGTGGPQPSASPSGGVMGVVSKSTGKSIRVYNGRSRYNEWAFIYTAPAQAPGVPAGGATPRGGQRQGGAGGIGGVAGPGGARGPGPSSPPFGSDAPGSRGRSGTVGPPAGSPPRSGR